MANIAIYGGSFNPIHAGHIHVAMSALKELNLDKVIFMPTASSPDKVMENVNAKHRVNMIENDIAVFESFEVSTFEVDKGGISYTIDTARHFKGSEDKIYFLIGSDSANTFDKWNDAKEISNIFDIIVVPRGGSDLNLDNVKEFNMSILEVEPMEISSSKIREGALIDLSDTNFEYAITNDLYVHDILSNVMSEKRKVHSYNVANAARMLAKRYGANEFKAYVAGLFHDIAKEIDCTDIMEAEFSNMMDQPEQTWHKWTGALLVEDNITNDSEIYDAIIRHSVCDLDYTTLDKILFVADTISEDRHKKNIKTKKLYDNLSTLDEDYKWSLKIKKSNIKK